MDELLPAEHQRVTRLFAECSELGEEARCRRLARILVDEPRIGAEVASLLEHSASAPAVLRTGGANRWASAGPEPEAPARIGPFRVVGRIAEGGMGVVYRAEQETPVRRTVAVKVLRRGIASARTLARFEMESQALALMNHVNIASVFDAGLTDDDRPWFAMEYVDGEPITTYCDRHAIDLRERLRLFAAVCDGVEHAHQKAIIHRDLKPSNVLVAGDARSSVPKIIDFGIAKVTHSSSDALGPKTTVGEILGTPDYMSPEQAELRSDRIDTRTDVYGLGLLLYELLCGSRPFENRIDSDSGFYEASRIIREVVPDRPSVRAGAVSIQTAAHRRSTPRGLRRALSGDLDSIVLRALEKAPERRYGAPATLADDVRRHLGGEPVSARNASTLYRLGSTVRRHRVAVALGAATLAVLGCLAVFLVVQNRRLIEQSAIAERNARVAERTRDFAFAVFHIANEDMSLEERFEMVDENLATLDSLFRENPQEHATFARKLSTSAGNANSDDVFALLDHALLRTLSNPPNDSPEMIETRTQVGLAAVLMERLDVGERLIEPAVVAAVRVFGGESPQAFETQIALGMLRYRQGRLDDAEAVFVPLIAEMTRILGPEHPRTLWVAARLGGVYADQGRSDEAEVLLRETIASLERVGDPLDGSVLSARFNLATALATKGEYEAAVAQLRFASDNGFHYFNARDGVPISLAEEIWSREDFQPLKRIQAFRDAYGPQGYLRSMEAVVNHAWNREWDAAIAQLEAAVDRGHAAEFVYRHPVVHGLRSIFPGFLESARRHGVEFGPAPDLAADSRDR